jgi:hypothetical protein
MKSDQFYTDLTELVSQIETLPKGCTVPAAEKLQKAFEPTEEQKMRVDKAELEVKLRQEAALKTKGKTFASRNTHTLWAFKNRAALSLFVICTWARSDIGNLVGNTFLLKDGTNSPTGFCHDNIVANVLQDTNTDSKLWHDQRLDFMRVQ